MNVCFCFFSVMVDEMGKKLNKLVNLLPKREKMVYICITQPRH